MRFSPTDAAFEGFRVVRRHPLALVAWTLFYLLTAAVSLAIVLQPLIRLMGVAEAFERSPPTSLEQFRPLLELYASMAVLVPLGLVLGAVMAAAVARAVLRPDEKAFGYLRLGADELRVVVVSIAVSLVVALSAGVLWMVAGITAGIAAATEQTWLILFSVLFGLGAVALAIWLAVRLCLAVPITVAERRIAVFDSFGLTKGRFWSLLGMALLAFVMTMVVSLLFAVVVMPVTAVVGGMAGLAAFEGQATLEVLRQAWPIIAVFVVANAIQGALQVAVLYAPFSVAYRDIRGG